MELLDYLAVLRKRWISVAATTALVLAAMGGFTLMSTPEYQATTRLFFAVPGGETVTDLAQGSSFTERQMSSYVQVATSPLVLEPVVDNLELGMSAEQLASSVRASVPANTVILEVMATSAEAAEAAAVANAVGRQLSEVVSDLYPERADGTQAVLATTLKPAEVPATPSSPNLNRNMAMGLLLGLGFGVGVALLLQSIDTKIRSSRDIAGITARPVLGSVVFDPGTASRPIAMLDEPNGLRAESTRRVRTNLQYVDLAKGPRAILITSSIEGEGKTTTAANLAVSLADAGSRVLLVDADLRRPSLQNVLGLEGGAGLTTVLIGKATASEVIQPWRGGRIDVLTAGPVPPNPSELLGSGAMLETLSLLKGMYDVVILDSPPLLPVTDAAVLSRSVDGTIVVVGAGRTQRSQLLSALQTLETVDSHLLGIVLNKVDVRTGSSYRYGYGSPYSLATKERATGEIAVGTPESGRSTRSRNPGRGRRHRGSRKSVPEVVGTAPGSVDS